MAACHCKWRSCRHGAAVNGRILFALLLAGFALFHGGTQVARAATRPNIVFVLTDDLAMNLLQYMPNVQKMQKAGTTFSRYFVTDSLCCPSRASILTGELPHNSAVFTNSPPDGGYEAF